VSIVAANTENEPFFRICLESWETIGSSPAFPGKAGIEFFGLIIFSGI